MILEEFDEEKTAIINPEDIFSKIDGIPKVAISCFAQTTFNRLVDELGAEIISYVGCANGRIPLYKANYKNKEFVLYMSSVGAASNIGNLEGIIARGVEKFIIFGTCGVLDSSISDYSIVIPNCAVRDEGISYHYAKSSDEIIVNKKYIDKFVDLLNQYNFNYKIGKVWTTDAFYRETAKKVERRKAMGCICVDMECSAIFALAEFRGVDVFQFFYAADNLDGIKWDKRSLSNKDALLEKDKIAFLALELALNIYG
ncbi:MAG: phosphorylase [Candidatus Delongbacteria bacterium]|nr:MAG: phosphorylase [Candidatus Delongbacteria bacterium]